MNNLHNVNIQSEQVLITPKELKNKLPLSEENSIFIKNSRETIANIIHKKDNRILIIAGPCSIHDIDAAKEYALKLKKLHDKFKDNFFIVMRVYFEKPRTTVGWKGMINDPDLDGTFQLEKGLTLARELMLWLADLQLPIATEALDPISPQYLSELISWSAIGARTTESQTHREMASGLSMPVGFKNGTDGKLDVAINALKSAASGHRFMGINEDGQVALLKTNGNIDGHVILRGGLYPNYDSVSVKICAEQLHAANLNARFVIDCSHGNSSKDHNRQTSVCLDIFSQIKNGNTSIIGVMLESNLFEGNQPDKNYNDLQYGVSITDACISFETTSNLLDECNDLINGLLASRFNK